VAVLAVVLAVKLLRAALVVCRGKMVEIIQSPISLEAVAGPLKLATLMGYRKAVTVLPIPLLEPL
jgi:hypothetical protein